MSDLNSLILFGGVKMLKKRPSKGFGSHNEDKEFGSMAINKFLSDEDDNLTIKLIWLNLIEFIFLSFKRN